MNEKILYTTILRSLTTEKSVKLADKYRQITFRVVKNSTKSQVKKAVEALFNVVDTSVRTINMKGKVKKFKRTHGIRKNWKKAIVSLKAGYDINFSEFEQEKV